MPARPVLLHPNPLLRTVCREVALEELGGDSLRGVVDDLVSTLHAQPGCVGLAAPQVGETVRVLVMDEAASATSIGAPSRLKVLINPKLVSLSQWKFAREGCLSFPEYLVTVKRARRALVRYLTPEGLGVEEELRDFAAVIVQHEVDHLDGILFLDRMKNPQTDLIRRVSREAALTLA